MLTLITLLGCTTPLEVVEKLPPIDLDGDGYTAVEDGGDDCVDTNAEVHPGATEACNNLDDDCNGSADDGVSLSWYADADADGYGDAGQLTESCIQPPGTVEDSTDCDDGDAATYPGALELCTENIDRNCDGSRAFEDGDGDGVPACEDCEDDNGAHYPGALETCDGVDEDCDSFVDEDAVGGQTWYPDSDGDGYGASTGSISACAQSNGDPPVGYAATSDDCNDSDGQFNPGAIESDCRDSNDYNCDGSTGGSDGDGDGYVACLDCNDQDVNISPDATESCDGIDNNCDGSVDESGTNAGTWYVDADGDGYGDVTAYTSSCAQPRGYVSDATDCDDADANTNPVADETCDEEDDNCDGVIDNNAIDPFTFYADADGDSYGDVSVTAYACEVPAGYVSDSTDCDDGSAAFNPGIVESNCADPTDYNCDGSVGYNDGDGDGFAACEECDDTNIDISPNAIEVCDGVDNDCDSDIDDQDGDLDSSTGTLFYADSDGDGYGNPASSVRSCEAYVGYVSNSSDCNDGNIDINPDTSWYRDADSDNYGNPTVLVASCTQPVGYVSNRTDCDDTTSVRSPGNTEVCDSGNIDEDCDNLADNNDSSASTGTKTTFYRDLDSDGYGASSSGTSLTCDVTAGYSATSTDCNDSSSTISPAGQEVCDSNNTDEDCDGLTDNNDSSALASGKTVFYRDSDSDNYGNASNSASYCDRPSGYVTNATDCNDAASGINPGAQEICDSGNTDEDCDGLADNNDSSAASSGKTTYYLDSDSDTYGNPSSTTSACDLPAGYVTNNTDCNDTNANISPGDPEICDSSNTDEDCDGSADNNDSSAASAGKTTYYRDVDGDTYGSTTSGAYCDLPSGYATNNTDCNDNAAAINPGATEICDAANTDEDCDTLADNNDTSASNATKSTFYRDADADNYGLLTSTTSACDAPSGYVASSTDCNDGSAAINPGATEICDAANTDEDCDGAADNNDSSASSATKSTFYRDADSDTYGSSSSTTTACDVPTGYVTNSTDCNDSLAAINPGAQEVCDASNTDEDCDGSADNNDSSAAAAGKTTYYRDSDSDTYGSSTVTTTACDLPSGYVTNSTDCNDASASINPGATEICDAANTDEDCDTLADNNDSSAASAGKTTFYRDSDTDTYGSSTVTTTACDLPSGYVTNSTDCNDASASINPGATEICDASNTDEDCDTLADNNDPTAAAAGKTTYYLDSDSDGYGSTAGSYCDLPSGYATVNGDCDDTTSLESPGNPEYCDGADVDNDCDVTSTDAGVVTLIVGAAYTDVSASWPTTSEAVTATSYTLPASGTIQVCAGTYLVELSATTATSVDIIGVDGAASTTLSSDGGAILTLGTTSALVTQEVLLDGFTLSDALRETNGNATYGGAIVVYHPSVPTNPQLTILDSILTGNDADFGGAITVGTTTSGQEGGYVLLSGSTLTGNGGSSTTQGGGVYVREGRFDCEDSSIDSNTAGAGSFKGGGIYLYGQSNTGTLVSSSGCSWGASSVDDNSPSDIDGKDFSAAYNLTGTQTVDFLCTRTGCTP